MKISIDNPIAVLLIKDDPSFVSEELFRSTPNGHKFTVGQECVLVGLEDFSEYNGDTVTITAIREDGSRGKAYYIRGRVNEMLNWVYEYRLARAESETQGSRS